MSAETMTQTLATLRSFAKQHGVRLETRGEVGFGRPCVGFIKDGNYVAHNPISFDTSAGIRRIDGFTDERLYPPADVENAYHKADCLAVLVHGVDYDAALHELALWVRHLDSLGTVEVVRYETGATGLQAMFSGTHDHAVRIVEPAKVAKP